MAQTVKTLPAMWEAWVDTLGWEDPLEEDMATHTSILAGESPGSEKPGRLQSMESQSVGHDRVTKHSTVQHLMVGNPENRIETWLFLSDFIIN